MSTDPFSSLRTDDDSCFLCGAQVSIISQEHVFPKWLQHRYNLWNQSIELLNETRIPYRSLLIPCCARCNNEDLSRLEQTIAASVGAGFEAASRVDKHSLYLWAGKLFFGILRKEIALFLERSTPTAGTIFPKESLRSFSALHLFLQGIRGEHEFPDAVPYSVLVCNLHDLGPSRNFNFCDSLFHMTLAIRLGEVGVIIALEDAGLTEQTYGRYVTEVAGRKLHPIQFDELYAKILYQVSLIEGGVTYLTSTQDSKPVPARTHVFNSGRLRPRSQEEFSKVLQPFVQHWLRDSKKTQWFVSPDLVPTWMTDQVGELLLRPFSEWESHGTD